MWLRHGQHVDFETQAHSRAASNCSLKTQRYSYDGPAIDKCMSNIGLPVVGPRQALLRSKRLCLWSQAMPRKAGEPSSTAEGEPCRLFGRSSSREPTACEHSCFPE